MFEQKNNNLNAGAGSSPSAEPLKTPSSTTASTNAAGAANNEPKDLFSPTDKNIDERISRLEETGTQKKKKKTVILIVLVVLLVIILIAGAVKFIFFRGTSNENKNDYLVNKPEATACPIDAKTCPDGTSVERVAPNCDFAPCPVASCRNEKYVCSVEAISCCENLTETPQSEEKDGQCEASNCGTVCLACGNGICDGQENKCNCPKDCGNVAGFINYINEVVGVSFDYPPAWTPDQINSEVINFSNATTSETITIKAVSKKDLSESDKSILLSGNSINLDNQKFYYNLKTENGNSELKLYPENGNIYYLISFPETAQLELREVWEKIANNVKWSIPKDSDQDSLFDIEEIIIYKTDLNNPDTDNDSYKDGEEVQKGYNPNGEGKL